MKEAKKKIKLEIEDTFWTTRWASDIVTLRKLENGDYEKER